MKDRIPSNIIVTVPDFSGPAAAMLAAFNKQQEAEGKDPAIKLEYREQGYVMTESGLYCLCTEGVGDSNPITDTNKLELEMHPAWQGSFAMFPIGSIELTDTELIMLPTLREEPLEEFIRSFGRRLEANYSIWLQHFKTNKPMSKEHA